MWTLYTADGFEEIAKFSTGSSMQRWLAAHPGLYAVDHGDGRMRSVGSRETRADRQRSYEELFSSTLPRGSKPTGAFVLRDGRRTSTDRRGTNHTHPPGRTRCPKCGV